MARYCRFHPHQKLVELFTSSVCDLCDPPKGAKPGPLYGLEAGWVVPAGQAGVFVNYPDPQNPCTKTGPDSFCGCDACWEDPDA